MAKVTVYRFQMWDVTNDTLVTSRRWGTKQAIERISGQILGGSHVEVDEQYLGEEIPGMTRRDFDPQSPPSSGFQRHVR